MEVEGVVEDGVENVGPKYDGVQDVIDHRDP